MTARDLKAKFPNFVAQFNGLNTLDIFYKRDRETRIYEFRTIEAEEHVATLMNVKVYEGSADFDEHEHRQLTEQELTKFKEDVTDIRQCLNELNKSEE